jgi:hypothetical protein
MRPAARTWVELDHEMCARAANPTRLWATKMAPCGHFSRTANPESGGCGQSRQANAVESHEQNQLVERDDLAGVHPSVAEYLDEVLDELVDARWLVIVPTGAPPRITHLGAGVTWVTGDHGSDGRG